MTIFDQFTFFRYCTAWTINKHSSVTIKDEISSLHNTVNESMDTLQVQHKSDNKLIDLLFECNTHWTISKHTLGTV